MNISKHKFHDEDVSFSFACDGVCLSFRDPVNHGESLEGILDKDDVIALAKHFKLTDDDIKGK